VDKGDSDQDAGIASTTSPVNLVTHFQESTGEMPTKLWLVNFKGVGQPVFDLAGERGSWYQHRPFSRQKQVQGIAQMLRTTKSSVPQSGKLGRSSPMRWVGCLAGVALASLSLCGCASFWDDVTSSTYDWKHPFTKPNPFSVLRDSTDGDERAKALQALREPKQFGGTDHDQDAVVKILVTGASQEKQFLCRLAAIESLGHFKDPRAVKGLTDAFYASGTYPPEQATRLQCQAAVALGETGNPEAMKFLLNVLRGPSGGGSDQEKQQVMDVRIAAARALGNFHDHLATEALARICQNEKDVALHDCAHDSLEACAGRKIPPDFKAWDELINQKGDTTVAEKREKFLGLF
jgi:hypothetical protein